MLDFLAKQVINPGFIVDFVDWNKVQYAIHEFLLFLTVLIGDMVRGLGLKGNLAVQRNPAIGIGLVKTGFEFLLENKSSKCIYCNSKLNENNATCDHIIPISKGGNNCKLNLIVCCIKCNSERGDLPFYEYLNTKNKNFYGKKESFI
jgi:hypothetical protein